MLGCFGKKSKRLVEANPEQLKRACKSRNKNRTGEDTIRLPLETVIINLPEEEKICKETGIPLQKMGEEVSHTKYAHPKQEEKGVIIALMPDTLLPKCRADNSLLAEIITRKFVDHLPLYRLAENMRRERIEVSRMLLSQWVVAAGLALYPLYQAMKDKILARDRLHIDESPVDLFDSPK